MEEGRVGLIVPLSLVCTSRTDELRQAIAGFQRWISCYDMRPSSLFEGVSQRLSILLAGKTPCRGKVLTGGYRRWASEERPTLISLTQYIAPRPSPDTAPVPKCASITETSVLGKLDAPPLQHLACDAGAFLYVHRIVRYFAKALDFLPTFRDAKGKTGKSEDYKVFRFEQNQKTQIAAALNSSLFYWFWRTHCDGFHCGYSDVYSFPFKPVSDETLCKSLAIVYVSLMQELRRESTLKRIKTKAGHITYQEFYPASAKNVLDEIDRVLAKHYGFTDEELDFIINYDIKYRMGGADDGEDGE